MKSSRNKTAGDETLGFQLMAELLKMGACSEHVCLDLITRGAAVNMTDHTGQTTLMFAILYVDRSQKIVRALVDAGADVNARDNNKFTALMFAARRGQTESVGILIDAGAKIRCRNVHKKSAADLAEEGKHWSITDKIDERLIRDGIGKEEKAFRKAVEKAEKIDHAAHHGADMPRETPPVPVMKKKPFKPGGGGA